MTTRMACGEAETAFESSYLTLLDQAPLLQRPRRHAHHPRGRWRGPAALRRGPGQPAARAVGRRLLRVGSRRRSRAPIEGTELTAVFRLVKVGGSAGLQHLRRPVHHERHHRRDRPARHDPDGLCRGRHGAGDRVPGRAPGRRPHRASCADRSCSRTSTGARSSSCVRPSRCRGSLPESERLSVRKPGPDVDAGDAQCQPVGEPQRAPEPDAVRGADSDAHGHATRDTVARHRPSNRRPRCRRPRPAP